MEKHSFTTSDFYKCVIDIVEQINRSISRFNFKLLYNISSTRPDTIDFTVHNEHLSGFRFICTKDEYKGGTFILNTVIAHIQEIIRIDIYKDVDPDVEYVDPEDLLHCHLTDCELQS